METVDLWEHQTEAIAKLREARAFGKTRIVLQAPPGAGKTEIAVEVTKAARGKGRFVAFTVPFLTLVDQALSRFEKRGISTFDIGVIQAKHERTNEICPVQVVSVQTLNKRAAFPLADVVIVDECHIQHKAIMKWMAACPEITFIGLSATPWAKGMADYWQELIVVETIRGLIDKKILTPFRTFAPPLKPDLSGVSIDSKTQDFATGELSEVMQDKRLVGDVVTTWLDKAAGRPTLVFAVDRAHAGAIASQFDQAGIRARYVDAFTERDERAEYIEQLRTGEVQVIVSIGTMTTGVDIPWVTCISFCRPTWSPILFVQSLARGLRAYEGKTDCLFLDHSDTTRVRLGQITDINFTHLRPGVVKKSRAVSHETPPRLPHECEACHFMVPPRTPQCPECGHIMAVHSNVSHEEGELEELGASPSPKQDNRVWEWDDKANFYGQMKAFATNRGYNTGWAANKYREKFGVWPHDHRVKFAREVEPTWETKRWIAETQRKWMAQQAIIQRKFGGNRR